MERNITNEKHRDRFGKVWPSKRPTKRKVGLSRAARTEARLRRIGGIWNISDPIGPDVPLGYTSNPLAELDSEEETMRPPSTSAAMNFTEDVFDDRGNECSPVRCPTTSVDDDVTVTDIYNEPPAEVENIVETGVPNTSEADDSEELEKNNELDIGRVKPVDLVGRQIVNFGYVFTEIHHRFDEHSKSLDCAFRDLVLTGTHRHGLRTQFQFECRMCHFKSSVWSDPPDDAGLDIHTAAAAGCITAGIGGAQLKEVLSAMAVQSPSSKTSQNYAEIVGEGFAKAAAENMTAAAEEEMKLAVTRGDVTKDGIAMIPVVADGSWMTRSYKTKYNSLAGVGAIVGYHTRKILFIGVRNKYCALCAYADAKDVEPRKHTCFKNWGSNKSSTSMESDAIAEGFCSSIEMHNLMYTELIADGDSSVYKKILNMNPYENVQVKKIECINHLLRNLCNKVKESTKGKGRIGNWRSVIEGKVKKFRSAVVKAVEYRNEEKTETQQKKYDLRRDILNIPHHIFGDHQNCASYFCGVLKSDEINQVPELKRMGLFNRFKDIVIQLSHHRDSLLRNVTSNMAESYNSVICKFIGGKRINFAKRGSYNARCSGAVVQYNTGRSLSAVATALKKIPSATVLCLENQRRHAKETKRRWATKRQSADKPKGSGSGRKRHCAADKDYGPQSSQPDLPEDEFQQDKKGHSSRLWKL
ncbi:uncharacterized protein LOC107269098 [Cephus cinctus]|uniref:Uncharacterized protein LOC107269098 n=1 Tax=Cephus cinctus TaxID=211228 RepID=A0AAJ7W2I5_CEPCN|nr:uncharacterized protein LOC107269098 [Cephus cinctus]